MNQLNPLISVIVPCYNYGHFLPDTLNSVLQQTYANWECIIVDDGSRDNTREVAMGFCKADSRFRYFYQANAGLSAARNTGLCNACGEYVQLLDADDKLEADKIRSQLFYLIANSHVDVLYGDVLYFTEGNAPMTRSLKGDTAWMPHFSGRGKKICMLLVRNNIMAVNCALVKKHVFNTVGNFDEQLKSLEDWDFWIRCAVKDCYFHYYQDPGNSKALVRVHAGSLSKHGDTMRKFHLQLLDKHMKAGRLGLFPYLYAITRYAEIYLDAVTGKKTAHAEKETFNSSFNTVSYFLFPVYFLLKGYRRFLRKKNENYP